MEVYKCPGLCTYSIIIGKASYCITASSITARFFKHNVPKFNLQFQHSVNSRTVLLVGLSVLHFVWQKRHQSMGVATIEAPEATGRVVNV